MLCIFSAEAESVYIYFSKLMRLEVCIYLSKLMGLRLCIYFAAAKAGSVI